MRPNSYPTDWMKAIRTPTPYRVGTARIQLKPRFVAYAALFTTALFVLFAFVMLPRPIKLPTCIIQEQIGPYNATYPITPPKIFESAIRYKIAMVADLDKDSRQKKSKHSWNSYYTVGHLTISSDLKDVKIHWEDTVTLSSSLAQGGRGMELSELVVFNGKLYAVDDRTGVIYQIGGKKVVPWTILSDGNGQENKGFKCEWAAVKDRRLYVGGLGKEWTSPTGEVENYNPQWVKSIGPDGDVTHINWRNNYDVMRMQSGYSYPGYLIHESGVWSEIHQRWFFLPRRASTENYEEIADEKHGTNLMIVCDEQFEDIEIRHVGEISPTHGFSSFKFIPGTQDNLIVALKSAENNGQAVGTYVMVFTVTGQIIYPEIKVGNYKYEGIEFV